MYDDPLDLNTLHIAKNPTRSLQIAAPDNDMSVIVDYPELLGFIESRVYLENLYMPSCLDLLDTAGGKIIFFYPTYRVPRPGGPDT